MANSNAGVPRGKTVHGARGYLVIDGKTVGYAQNINGQETVEYQPVDCLDNLEVEEHVPVAYTATVNVAVVRVVDRSLKAAGIQVPIADVLTSGELTIEIKDRPTDQPIYVFEGCKASGKSFSIAKRALTIENVNFVCKRLRDESGLV